MVVAVQSVHMLVYDMFGTICLWPDSIHGARWIDFRIFRNSNHRGGVGLGGAARAPHTFYSDSEGGRGAGVGGGGGAGGGGRGDGGQMASE